MHVLVRAFLNVSRSRYTGRVIRAFWQNYFDPISQHTLNRRNTIEIVGDTMLDGWSLMSQPASADAYKEDFHVLQEILTDTNKHSHNFALFLAIHVYGRLRTMDYILSWSAPDHEHSECYNSLQELMTTAISIVWNDCIDPTIDADSEMQVDRLIMAYHYTLIPASSSGISLASKADPSLLLACEVRVAKLRFNSKIVARTRAWFHSQIDILCLEPALKKYDVCQHRWQYRLFVLGVSFMPVGHSTMDIFIVGMRHYAVMKDDEAIMYLESAINHFSNVEHPAKAVAYMMLYDIYCRNDTQEIAQVVLHHIRTMLSELTAMECPSSLYGLTIIPFLRSVGEMDLARGLCGLWLENFFETADLKCDRLVVTKLFSREIIAVFSFCEDYVPFI